MTAGMLVELRGVNKRYGDVHALRDVSAEIGGKVIGLLGPNGAGKSTLLKAMLGLLEFDGGVRVLGLDPVVDSFAIRDRVGYMPEMESYLAEMTAVELCTYAGELGGLPRNEAMQRAHAALYYANLEDKRYQKVESYSTGLKQRVKLAQALVHDPELLFLDEPTNGLDPGAREEMLELIAELPRRRDCAIIVSTHLLPDVERLCDHVVIMQSGAVRFCGTMAELRAGDGGDAHYDLEIKGELAALAARLEAAGCGVEPRPPVRLAVELPAGETPALVLREARAAGVQVRRLEPQRLSLEAAFFRELEAEAAPEVSDG